MISETGFFEDEKFEKIDFTTNPLPVGEYDHCVFLKCNFSNADLSNVQFTDCEFIECNLSSVKLNKTALHDIAFKSCKLVGLQFDKCQEFLFSANFDDCILSFSSFYKLKIKKTVFRNTTLHETDFTDTDLTGAVFERCDLARATFENTTLEKADLRTAFNYSIDPEINRIKKAKFSRDGIAGLLEKYEIVIE
jgi:fluoroquinolone resistance protein